MTNQEIVEMVTAKAGGESAVARALGIKVQSVQKWKKSRPSACLPSSTSPAFRAKNYGPDIFAISKGVLTLVEVKGPRPAGRKKKINRASGKGGRLPSRKRSQRVGNALLGLIRTVALRLQHRQQGIQRDGCEAGVGQPR